MNQALRSVRTKCGGSLDALIDEKNRSTGGTLFWTALQQHKMHHKSNGWPSAHLTQHDHWPNTPVDPTWPLTKHDHWPTTTVEIQRPLTQQCPLSPHACWPNTTVCLPNMSVDPTENIRLISTILIILLYFDRTQLLYSQQQKQQRAFQGCRRPVCLWHLPSSCSTLCMPEPQPDIFMSSGLFHSNTVNTYNSSDIKNKLKYKRLGQTNHLIMVRCSECDLVLWGWGYKLRGWAGMMTSMQGWDGAVSPALLSSNQ